MFVGCEGLQNANESSSSDRKSIQFESSWFTYLQATRTIATVSWSTIETGISRHFRLCRSSNSQFSRKAQGYNHRMGWWKSRIKKMTNSNNKCMKRSVLFPGYFGHEQGTPSLVYLYVQLLWYLVYIIQRDTFSTLYAGTLHSISTRYGYLYKYFYRAARLVSWDVWYQVQYKYLYLVHTWYTHTCTTGSTQVFHVVARVQSNSDGIRVETRIDTRALSFFQWYWRRTVETRTLVDHTIDDWLLSGTLVPFGRGEQTPSVVMRFANGQPKSEPGSRLAVWIANCISNKWEHRTHVFLYKTLYHVLAALFPSLSLWKSKCLTTKLKCLWGKVRFRQSQQRSFGFNHLTRDLCLVLLLASVLELSNIAIS